MGTKRAFVVHGSDGLDEVTVSGETRVAELHDGIIRTYNINPVDYFGKTYPLEAIRGGDPELNARITKDVLTGKTGACRDIVIFNAALAIVAADTAADIKEGIKLAADAIKAATERDTASGYGVDVFTITKEGIKQVSNQKGEWKYTEQ